MNATSTDLVLARLESQDGRRAWSRGIAHGTPRPLRLLEAVQSATGLIRYEDIAPVMEEVDSRILAGALLPHPSPKNIRQVGVGIEVSQATYASQETRLDITAGQAKELAQALKGTQGRVHP